MKRSDFDHHYVLRHTLLPALTALVALGLLLGGIWLHERESQLFSQVSADQGALHEDYDSLVYRRRLVDRYHRRYEEFFRLGFVGRERRLDWIETLRETKQDLTLPRVSYAIEPQLRAIAPVESILAGEDIQIHLSRAQLEIGLVHELDLLHFIAALQNNAPGLIKVDSCDLTWQAAAEEQLTAGANILASCSMQIYSLLTSDVTELVARQ